MNFDCMYRHIYAYIILCIYFFCNFLIKFWVCRNLTGVRRLSPFSACFFYWILFCWLLSWFCKVLDLKGWLLILPLPLSPLSSRHYIPHFFLTYLYNVYVSLILCCNLWFTFLFCQILWHRVIVFFSDLVGGYACSLKTNFMSVYIYVQIEGISSLHCMFVFKYYARIYMLIFDPVIWLLGYKIFDNEYRVSVYQFISLKWSVIILTQPVKPFYKLFLQVKLYFVVLSGIFTR